MSVGSIAEFFEIKITPSSSHSLWGHLIAMDSDIGFQAALEEARKGASEGGIPIGACLVSADGKVLGQGHNMRIQKSSATLHVGIDTDD